MLVGAVAQLMGEHLTEIVVGECLEAATRRIVRARNAVIIRVARMSGHVPALIRDGGDVVRIGVGSILVSVVDGGAIRVPDLSDFTNAAAASVSGRVVWVSRT